MSATAACILQLGLYAPHRTDVLFSFLPLAHTMERCAELAVYMAGGAVGFYSGQQGQQAAASQIWVTLFRAVLKMLQGIKGK